MPRVTLASGVRLSCLDHGPVASSAVVFLPGPTDSCVSYEAVLAHLPTDMRAMAVSQRGHGDSDKPATGYRITDFAADAVAVLDAAGVERAVVVGHSGSCPVVRRVCLDHPGRVAGMVLEAAPTTLRGNAGLTQFVNTVVAGMQDPIDPDVARNLVADTSTDTVDPALLDRLVTEVCKVPADVWREMFGALLQYDDTADLRTITTPTLLIWGDEDPIVSRAMQDELAAALRARLLAYAGVGHTPRWEEPARFAADVAAFARDVL